MAGSSSNLQDVSLQYLIDNTERIVFLSAEPSTYADVTTYELGDKDTPTFGSIGDNGDNRQVSVAAFTDGVGTATGTCSYFALVNDTDSELIVWRSVSTTFTIADGADIEIASFSIDQPPVTA